MNPSAILKHVVKPEQMRKIALVSAKAFKPVNNIGHRFGPEILTGVGIAGGVTAAVLGARATLKLEPILDQMQTDINRAREAADIVSNVDAGEKLYPASEVRKIVTAVKIRGGAKIAKLYLPAVSLGIASVGCVLAAHGIMKKRNVAMVAAYNALEKSFEAYRARVVEEFGEDKDRDYRFGIREETVKDEETGKNKTVAKYDEHGYSLYAKAFAEGNPNWEANANYNLVFLNSQQQYANNMLRARGHVFLNDVYDSLGIERTPEGAVTGWLWGGDGDNYVDFGIYDIRNERHRAFVNGQEASIWLDFNVDGLIWEKIGKKPAVN